MKSIAVAVLMLLASANTLPTITQDELKQERFVEDMIIGVINDVIQRIVAAGLDPYEIAEASGSFSLSEPDVFSASGRVENLLFTGLSNIDIINIDFSILATRLRFDLALPRLALSVGDSGAEAVVFGRDLEAQGSGSLVINQLRLKGDARANVGAISGITIRSLSLSFTLGGIESNLKLVILGRDISDTVNNYLSTTLPNALQENQKPIDDLLEYIALKVIERILS